MKGEVSHPPQTIGRNIFSAPLGIEAPPRPLFRSALSQSLAFDSLASKGLAAAQLEIMELAGDIGRKSLAT